MSESVLKTTISQLRAVLSDTAAQPRYIETVPRRGYRFSGRVQAIAIGGGSGAPAAALSDPASAQLVGRTAALQRLQAAWQQAQQGQRQLVWVAGDAGIGKSTLLTAFAERCGAAVVVRAQCIEAHGAGEPYLPILEALGWLARRYPELPPMLRTIAPTWLLQLPWLISDADRSTLHRELAGVHQDRMVRELTELIERFTQQRPMLFIIEDLHWCDTATLRLLDHFARGRTVNHLMWLGSVRLTQVIAEGHPLQSLRQELRLHRLCTEITLEPFSETEVADYLSWRLPQARIGEAWVRRLHEHTDGLPLFVTSVIETLLDTDGLQSLQRASPGTTADATAWEVVPDTVADAIEAQIARLPAEHRALLESASVIGMEFPAAWVAELIDRDAAWVSEQCDALLRRQYWLRPVPVAALADGSLDVRYVFKHALYRHVFYRRIADAHRVQLHRRIAAVMERDRSVRGDVTSAALAAHHELGLQLAAAVRHAADAAQSALTHFAPREAAHIAAHALDLLHRCPSGADRWELELTLVSHRGVACSQAHGIAAAETRAAFERAHELYDLLPSSPVRARMLNGLGWVSYVRGEYAHSLAIARRLYALADRYDDQLLRLCACNLLGVSEQMQGNYRESLRWLDAGLAACDALGEQLPETLFVVHPAVLLRVNRYVSLLHLGYVDQARESMAEACRRADALRQPMGKMVTLWNLATLEMRLQRPERVAQLAESLGHIVAAAALPQGEGPSRWVRGWAEAHLGQPREGHQRILEGYAQHEKLGMHAACAEVLGYAAEALLMDQQWEAAGEQAEAAMTLADRLGERLLVPYLLILQARSAAGGGKAERARSLLRRALEAARSQQSLWYQLRVLTALCELQPVDPVDRQALREVCEVMPEGHDCVPWLRAREIGC